MSNEMSAKQLDIINSSTAPIVLAAENSQIFNSFQFRPSTQTHTYTHIYIHTHTRTLLTSHTNLLI